MFYQNKKQETTEIGLVFPVEFHGYTLTGYISQKVDCSTKVWKQLKKRTPEGIQEAGVESWNWFYSMRNALYNDRNNFDSKFPFQHKLIFMPSAKNTRGVNE
ncbi:hypothetical protein AAG570_006616 [Ranatra chinensis]|uniref:Uncharacterized protein n=1 Tax=Ranatra chinensis TaxID=642074 RepID=A0ABD0YUI7_9HEMI